MKKVDLKKHVLKSHEELPSSLQNRPIILAVSGGRDSSVLAAVALELRDRLPPLHMAHVNYHLRCPDSDREAAFLKGWAKREGIPIFIQNLYPKTKPKNLQAWARERRIKFFLRLSRRLHPQGAVVWAAHHLQDQAETVLDRLLRGAGLRGLGGMEPMETALGFPLFRPLLNISPEAIAIYAGYHRLPYRQDRSNQSSAYFRNRIRHKIIPLLQKENPQFLETISNLAQRAREADKALEEWAKSFLRKASRRRPLQWILPVHALRSLPSGMHAAVCRRWLSDTTGLAQSLDKVLPRIQIFLSSPRKILKIPLKGGWECILNVKEVILQPIGDKVKLLAPLGRSPQKVSWRVRNS